jgi:hypothetical protein
MLQFAPRGFSIDVGHAIDRPLSARGLALVLGPSSGNDSCVDITIAGFDICKA